MGGADQNPLWVTVVKLNLSGYSETLKLIQNFWEPFDTIKRFLLFLYKSHIEIS